MDAQLTLESKEWTKFFKDLDKKWKDIKGRKEFGGIIDATVYQDVISHFEQQMGPDGKWAPFSTSYLESINGVAIYRRIRGTTVRIPVANLKSPPKPPRTLGKLLQVTGNLRQRFQPQSWRAKTEGILFYNNAKTKSGFPYAYAHDTGGPKLPKRSFMWLSSRGMQGIIDKTERWLAEG